MNSILAKNHLSLIVSNDIDEICKPLKKFGIKLFTYLKNYRNGAQIYLSNDSRWTEDYYNKKLYESSLFELNPAIYPSGYTLWPKDSSSKVFIHARTYFDSDHGITIIENQKKFCEFYFFSTSASNPSIINLYLNNIDLLKRFVVYFKDKASAILKTAEKNKIIIPQHFQKLNVAENDVDFILHSMLLNTSLKKEFLKEIRISHYRFEQGDLKNIILTEKELDCAFALLEGKTANETGEKLFRSRRTIETHISNMKSKFHCKTKSDLIAKLLDNGFGIYIN
jgi:DNA-binding CsgD family transcriptional regulator